MLSPSIVHRIGDTVISRIDELPPLKLAPGAILAEWNESMHDSLGTPSLAGSMDPATGNLLFSIHTWLVRTHEHTILIDSGAGNGKSRPLSPNFNGLDTPFLDRLAAAGARPEDVDFIFITHLHVDHVGWNTRLDGERWVPTFPNARHVFSRSGQEFYSDLANYPDNAKPKHLTYLDSVQPILDAGLAELVDPNGSEYLPGISLHSVEGHCPGQMAVALATSGGEALFVGDAAHHPLQVLRPDVNSVWCVEPNRAVSSRLWTLERAASNGSVYFASHFSGTSAGYVGKDGDRFTWCYRQPDVAGA